MSAIEEVEDEERDVRSRDPELLALLLVSQTVAFVGSIAGGWTAFKRGKQLEAALEKCELRSPVLGRLDTHALSARALRPFRQAPCRERVSAPGGEGLAEGGGGVEDGGCGCGAAAAGGRGGRRRGVVRLLHSPHVAAQERARHSAGAAATLWPATYLLLAQRHLSGLVSSPQQEGDTAAALGLFEAAIDAARRPAALCLAPTHGRASPPLPACCLPMPAQARCTEDRVSERKALRGVAASKQRLGDVRGALDALLAVLTLSDSLGDREGDKETLARAPPRRRRAAGAPPPDAAAAPAEDRGGWRTSTQTWTISSRRAFIMTCTCLTTGRPEGCRRGRRM